MDEGAPRPRPGAPVHDEDGVLARAARHVAVADALARRGVVERAGDGVALVAGLDDVAFEELIAFDSGGLGMAYDLRPETSGVLLLDGTEHVRAGDGAQGLRALATVAVGPETLGRVIDPLGRPLDGLGPLPERRLPLFRPAPALVERKPVDEPLWTGVMVIDAAIPIGRGQRELIIGDRNVGKTALAIDVVAAQRDGDVACVYVVVGQPLSRVLTLRETLASLGCLHNTAIVTADAAATPGMRYLAPYAGASIAEWFRDRGGHALVVYDDLTKHADAYRELALLLDRPPGREAYPGDVFHVHAELLERAAARRPEAGGGSVTALPLIETTEGDLAAYIPTNVISITDGQIRLDTTRFERDLRPAVHVGLSVSRIGGAAQPPALRAVARELRILHARFEQLEALARVGLELDPALQTEIRRGRMLRELLRQKRARPRDVARQVVTLLALGQGWLDEVEPVSGRRAMKRIFDRARAVEPELVAVLDGGRMPDGPWIETLAATAREALPEPAGAAT
jgi:F-type H+-transporting ATPase subunit alpha